jgi:hypothetical protein
MKTNPSQRIKSNQSTLAAKRTVKSPFSCIYWTALIRMDGKAPGSRRDSVRLTACGYGGPEKVHCGIFAVKGLGEECAAFYESGSCGSGLEPPPPASCKRRIDLKIHRVGARSF